MQAEQQSERGRFALWANRKGYDTAYTYDTERSRWVFFTPMTADLWACWQDCAALVAAQEREANAQLAENYDLGTPEGHDIARLIRARKEET